MPQCRGPTRVPLPDRGTPDLGADPYATHARNYGSHDIT